MRQEARNFRADSGQPGTWAALRARFGLRMESGASSRITVIIPLMDERQLSPLDRILSGIDTALRSASPSPTRPARPNPAANIVEATLSKREKSHAAGLMRVNHAGEIAAQGLYQGHAALARDAAVEQQMKRAADEELDHLGWCEERLTELDSGPSKLRPLWYAGAFAIGAASGVLGDKWSLGFIEENRKAGIRSPDRSSRQAANE